MNAAHAEEKPYDYLIQGAIIFDGISPNGRAGDVAVASDAIAAIGTLDPEDAMHVIDARGLALAPGFIDVHTHSDFNPIVYPGLENKIMQGVTTEITGNCGMSAAPLAGAQRQYVQEVWAREGVKLPGDIPWSSFREYQNAIEEAGTVTNLVNLVGHGNLRAAVMGYNREAASPAQLEKMKSILNESMAQGAYGISFGLVYLPGIFAQEAELTELCRTASAAGGLCAFHMRNEGSKLLEAVDEVIRIAEKTGARIQISHLKASGQTNWDKIGAVLQKIETARGRGLKIEADLYPYTASFAELGVQLPDDLYERPDRADYFKNSANRAAILKKLKAYYGSGKDWNAVMIASIPNEAFARYEGRTLQEIAKTEAKAPEAVLLDLLIQTNFQVSAFSFSQNEAVVKQILVKPYVTIGSDSIADGSRRTHPRSYGAFPKVIHRYVRAESLLRMGNAIRKMTSGPAEHFRLKDRGRIEPGLAADLVLFDPAVIQDTADYTQPNALSRGVQWVFVNGEPVVKEGKFTGEKAGQFLLRTG